MKKLTAVASALAGVLVSGAASAQETSVTLYGVIDISVRHDNVSKNGSTTFMDEGAFQGPRFGLKGTENLGDGNHAIFQLESGFQPMNGSSDQQGQLFGRQAYAGLSNDTLGQITFGRQYGVNFLVLGNYDPLGMGNWGSNSWQTALFGLRYDNTIQYAGTWGPLSVTANYSLGGRAGQTSGDGTVGAGASYTIGGFSIGASGHQAKDLLDHKQTAFGAGLSYTFGPFTFDGIYFIDKTDGGFATGAGNTLTPGTWMNFVAGNTVLQRKDDYFQVGGTFSLSSANQLLFGFMDDNIKNQDDSGAGGKIQTLYVDFDHALSKRTDVYFGVDYTKLNAAAAASGLVADTILGDGGSGNLGSVAKQHSTDFGFGFRHKF